MSIKDAQDNQIWTGGINAVRQALDAGHLHALYVDERKQSHKVTALMQDALASNIPVERVAGYHIDLQLPGVRHQGVMALCQQHREHLSWQACITGVANPLLLVLDSIQDPHNLGACLRSAAAASVNAVIIPKSRSAELTPTVRKVACGGADIVPVFSVANLRRELETMQQRGIWVVGGAGEAETSLYQLDLRVPLAIVLGNESEGLHYGLRQQCDYLAAIPLDTRMESLNVSVACAVMLFEARRQRLAT